MYKHPLVVIIVHQKTASHHDLLLLDNISREYLQYLLW